MPPPPLRRPTRPRSATPALILTAAPFLAAGAIMLLSPEFYGEVIHL